ncbi:glycoside hydrolase family 6 protein [Streptomyces sp. ASQP_92]|uniref:glycoside hydrolase family 6 protein n=1 Tax=Streptomyces sp. ASQP_92 TaxID=2979116 RepID=UPI0021BDFB21|nr:glycoside hydrolase family 6 protein [Streptomyces sp. ASQP_92]MCT9090075.1 glycoside hydrolase family 6 protein [Streptomyces sp. ASQP_92]
MSRWSRSRVRCCLAVLAAALSLGFTAPGSAPRAGEPYPGPYWVNPVGPAARQAAEWRGAGRAADAELIERISLRPQADWPRPEDIEQSVRALTGDAARAGRMPVLVAYNIPHRDCGGLSQGGAEDAAAYRTWIEAFARGIGDRPATVIVEPDAIAHLVSGCPGAPSAERLSLLAHAVGQLKRGPATKVYLDTGHSGWVTDQSTLLEPLRKAGVEQADGFSLNVSAFQTTASSAEYGHRLSAALGGKHFVIDTSRNGNGPYTGGEEPWCNPPGRALGTPPTAATGDALIDAYLWVKRPGESDGTCRGGPQAGRWWPEYALGLARAAGGPSATGTA